MHDSLKYIRHNGRASGGFSLFQSSSHSIFVFLIFSWSFPNEPQSGVASKQRTASFGNVSSLVRHWPLSFIGRFELSKVQRTFALGTPTVQMYIRMYIWCTCLCSFVHLNAEWARSGGWLGGGQNRPGVAACSFTTIAVECWEIMVYYLFTSCSCPVGPSSRCLLGEVLHLVLTLLGCLVQRNHLLMHPGSNVGDRNLILFSRQAAHQTKRQWQPHAAVCWWRGFIPAFPPEALCDCSKTQ